MKVCLVGYGKMGKAIEGILLSRGHEISGRISKANADALVTCLTHSDMAIEFSRPEKALHHIETAIEYGVPMVCGTTGWAHNLPAVESMIQQKNGTFLHASNFSVGVQLFFALNRHLAKLMACHAEYQCVVTDIHHIHKLDAPSGTAITLANDIITNHPKYSGWSLESGDPNTLHIHSKREGEIIGTHLIQYQSKIDEIQILHQAHNRDGFASGAVLAAEWLLGKKGIYTMQDVLGITS